MQLDLRPYQSAAFDQARELIRQGKRRILVVAPTGAGKSVIASALLEMAASKGNRATVVMDRLSLIGQTSEMLDRYGIAHGVIQSQHPRFRMYEPVQVCSVQTLAKRGWPESQVDVFDEAHVLHACHKHRMASNSIVIGLTATPFTRGLGKYFDAVINVTTTRTLINEGWLSKYRIFSCAEPDMTGARVKSGGEWNDTDASDRAVKIVGDVVGEYTTHGSGRKFICSAVDTRHVEELARQFRDAGINVATYTYQDRDQDRADTVREFRKPDSDIRGLITVTAASRGFDVPDVSCVIMARPLRKSLAEHIQLFGRGLRIADGKDDCLARGTLVLTDRGEVPIENITLDHKVWDGENFVTHGGAVCKGFQAVIEYDGLIATPDHEVFTDDGWTRFEEAARRQRRIARTGIAGQPVRLVDDLLTQRAGQRQRATSGGAVQSLWRDALHALSQLAQAPRDGGLSALQWAPAGAGAAVAVSAVPSTDGSVQQPEFTLLRALRGAWNRVQVRLGQRGSALDCGESRGAEPRAATGSQGQRGALRAGESALGHGSSEPEQHAGFGWQGALHRLSQGLSWGALRGRNADQAARNDDAAGSRGALETVFLQTQREVWDVHNAGPLQRFTANGRLVHNCIVLDHTGNCARFYDACETFFDQGQSELDDGKKRERKQVTKKEREPVKCPQCRALHNPSPVCPCCGHQYPRKQAIQHVGGELFELDGNKRNHADAWPEKVRWMRSLTGYANERGYAQGWAAHKYRERYGVWPNDPRVHGVEPKQPDGDVLRWIRSRMIAYAKRRSAA